MASPFTQVQDQTLVITSGLVAGQWRSAKKTFPIYEPSSATVLTSCADLGHKDILEAIDSAETGTKKFFENTTARERGALLRNWFELVTAQADDCE